MEFDKFTHPPRMNCSNFSNLLIFHLAPPSGQNIILGCCFMTKHLETLIMFASASAVLCHSESFSVKHDPAKEQPHRANTVTVDTCSFRDFYSGILEKLAPFLPFCLL